MTIDWIDAEELAAKILELGDNYDSDSVEQALYDKFEISFEAFHKIIEALAPMAMRSKSELTGMIYAGFAELNGTGGFYIAKVEMEL